MDYDKELAQYKAAQEKEVEEEEKAKARRNFKATFCFYGKACKRHANLTCSWSHGTTDADLDFCLCTAWWCLKSHPNRAGNRIPDDIVRRSPPDNYVCKRCNTSGHYVQDCPENVCHYCREKGHIASKCPRRIHYHKRKRDESVEKDEGRVYKQVAK